MPENPNIRFDEPQSLSRTFVRMTDERGPVFDIAVTGPDNILRAYTEKVPLQLKWVPSEDLQEREQSARPTDDKENIAAQSEQHDKPLQEEKKKEPAPEYPINALDIEINLAQAPPEGYDLRVEVDPDIGKDVSHNYDVKLADAAWATCEVVGGDADLYLYEQRADGTWELRDWSLNWDTEPEKVSAEKEETGNWRLRVYGYIASTYALSGLFKPFEA